MNGQCPPYRNVSAALPAKAFYEDFYFPGWDMAPLRPLRAFMSVLAMLLMVAGSAGNLLTLVALWRYRGLRASTRLFFVVIAAADTVCFPMYSSVWWYIFTFARNFFHDSAFLCNVFPSFSLLFMFFSWCSLAAVALERFLLVSMPQKMRATNAKKYGVVNIAVVAVVSFIGSARYWGYAIDDNCICIYGWPPLFLEIIQSFMYVVYVLVMGQIFFSAFALRQVLKKRQRAVQPGKSGERSTGTMTPVIMIFAVGSFQFVTTLPLLVWLALEFIFGHEKTLLTKGVDAFIKNTVYVAMSLTFGSNFYIYMLSSRGFRTAFFSYLPMKRRIEVDNSVSFTNGDNDTNP